MSGNRAYAVVTSIVPDDISGVGFIAQVSVQYAVLQPDGYAPGEPSETTGSFGTVGASIGGLSGQPSREDVLEALTTAVRTAVGDSGLEVVFLP